MNRAIFARGVLRSLRGSEPRYPRDAPLTPFASPKYGLAFGKAMNRHGVPARVPLAVRPTALTCKASHQVLAALLCGAMVVQLGAPH